MLGSLRGIVLEVSDDQLILEVSGVGYVVQMSRRNLLDIKVGQEIRVFVVQSVGRDGISVLYGCKTTNELKCIKMFSKVSGVGYKTAMNILSKLEVSDIMNALIEEDIYCLTKIAGLSKKVAERAIVDLKTRAHDLTASLDSNQSLVTQNWNSPDQKEKNNALEALMSLGYSKDLAVTAIGKILAEHPDINNTEQIIKAVLQHHYTG